MSWYMFRSFYYRKILLYYSQHAVDRWVSHDVTIFNIVFKIFEQFFF